MILIKGAKYPVKVQLPMFGKGKALVYHGEDRIGMVLQDIPPGIEDEVRMTPDYKLYFNAIYKGNKWELKEKIDDQEWDSQKIIITYPKD